MPAATLLSRALGKASTRLLPLHSGQVGPRGRTQVMGRVSALTTTGRRQEGAGAAPGSRGTLAGTVPGRIAPATGEEQSVFLPRRTQWVRKMGQGWKGPIQVPPSPAEARGVGDRGQERTGAPLRLSLPSPSALLSFCTSAGNVPLTYIFFQTYVTFFFSSVGGDRQESKKRRSWRDETRTRKPGGLRRGSCKH